MRPHPTRFRAMVGADGYRVEQILVQRSLRRPPRPALRITWRGRRIADAALSTRSASTWTSPRWSRPSGDRAPPAVANNEP
jgi:hypothetical protein